MRVGGGGNVMSGPGTGPVESSSNRKRLFGTVSCVQGNKDESVCGWRK